MIKVQASKIQTSKMMVYNRGLITISVSFPYQVGSIPYYITGEATINWGGGMGIQKITTGHHYTPYFQYDVGTFTLSENGGSGLTRIEFNNFFITNITFQLCKNLQTITLENNTLYEIYFTETPNIYSVDLLGNSLIEWGMYEDIFYSLPTVVDGFFGTTQTVPPIPQYIIDIANNRGWEVVFDF
jgi:hypothetical protein